MCVAYFLWRHSQAPDLLLLALFNRDEILDRPTAPTHFWEDQQHIVGGRDLVAGGTWLCVSKEGRAAFLTNFREKRGGPAAVPACGGAQPGSFLDSPDSLPRAVPSRGELPVGFVRGDANPEQYLSSLNKQSFDGFNLIVADLAAQHMAYICSKSSMPPVELAPGLHGMTNGHMDAHWPKVDEGWRQLQSLLDGGAFSAAGSTSASGRTSGNGASGHSPSCTRTSTSTIATGSRGENGNSGEGMSSSGSGNSVPWEELFRLLSDDRLLETDPARLPQTGYGPELEAAASGIFVQPIETPLGQFGTRSQVVLAVWQDGGTELRERYRDDKDGSWKELQHSFKLDLRGGQAQQEQADGEQAEQGQHTEPEESIKAPACL